MSKILVTYFSASGVTKSIAEKIANTAEATLFEIEPVEKYTKEDLDWTNQESRSSKEMDNREYRPPVKNKVDNLNEYDKVAIGFPVWWDVAPTVVNTFIEENNLSGKEIFIFVTSGGSGIEGSLKDLKERYPNLNIINGLRFKGNETEETVKQFINLK